MTRKAPFTIIALALLLATTHSMLLAQDNPFLGTYNTPFQTPPFDRIQPQHFVPAFQEGVKQHLAELNAIADNPEPPTFDNTVAALDMAGELVDRVTKVYYSLIGLMRSPELQGLTGQIGQLRTDDYNNTWMHSKLFARVKAVYDQRTSLKLTAEQLYLLERIYNRFRTSGASLDDKQKDRNREILSELTTLHAKFFNNLQAETNASFIVIDNQADLAGLPDNIISIGENEARTRNMPGKWVFTTQRTSWTPFLQFAQNRKLRQQLYTAYLMRCNRDNDYDNKAVWQKMIVLAEETSRQYGYPSLASFLLEDRMAGSAAVVDSFLWRLWRPTLKRAKAELAEMQAIADSEHAGFRIQPWDWWYYAEKLRKAKYDLDDTQLRPYFELENVVAGAFTLAQKLYGLKLVERKDIPVYHPDVRVYEVRDSDGHVLALLYTDFYARQSKGGIGSSGSFRFSCYRDGQRIIPLSTLIGVFAKPSPGTPTLLSIDEVKVVFHEFGHCLHAILSDKHYRSNFLPVDAQELPSQITEEWALTPELLKLYAKHYQTGAVIPTALVERLNNSYLFNKGFEEVEYLAACFLDMAWHELDSAQNVNVNDFERDVMTRIGLIPEILPRYHIVYFTHVTGNYAAGYYSYDWSGVLEADAFQAFKETSLFDKKTATSFRKNILERLGIEDAMTLYKRFRGREPNVEPFLRKKGLI